MERRDEQKLLEPNTLNGCLFSLAVQKPINTKSIVYLTLGHYLKKKKFYQFIRAVKRNIDIDLDTIVYSRIVIEKSKIDEQDYLEISLNKICNLPIAGKQFPMLVRHAEHNKISLINYIHSLNFILNDSRNFTIS